MRSTWLKGSLPAVLSVAGWLALIPQPAQGGIVGVAVGVWAWRNVAAPQIGGPFVAPEYRFRPFNGYVADRVNNQVFTEADSQATVTVRVPDANAHVWIEGTLTQQTGRERIFLSPPLERGSKYSYTIRARWRDDKKATDQTRSVRIRAGQQVVVDFSLPEKK